MLCNEYVRSVDCSIIFLCLDLSSNGLHGKCSTLSGKYSPFTFPIILLASVFRAKVNRSAYEGEIVGAENAVHNCFQLAKNVSDVFVFYGREISEHVEACIPVGKGRYGSNLPKHTSLLYNDIFLFSYTDVSRNLFFLSCEERINLFTA